MRIVAMTVLVAVAFSSTAQAESAWTLLEKGIKSFQKKKYDRAEQYLTAARRMNAKCYDALYYLGAIYQKRGDHKTAEKAYAKVPKDAPTFALACGRLGHIALKKGDFKAAEERFTVLAKAQPTTNSWMQVAAVQMPQERYKEAEASIAEAAKFSKGNLDLTELKARLYMETKRFPEALKCYTEILEKIPVDSTARYLRGYCLNELKRSREALAEWNKVLEKDPWHQMTLGALIQAYEEDAGKEELVAEYQRRIEILKKNPPKVRRVSGSK